MADDEDFWAGPTLRQQIEQERRQREAAYARVWRRNVIVVVMALLGAATWYLLH